MVTIALELIFYGVMLAAMILFYGWIVTPIVMIKIFLYAKVLTKDILRVTGNLLAILFSGYFIWTILTLFGLEYEGKYRSLLLSIYDKMGDVFNRISFGRLENVSTFIEHADGTSTLSFIIALFICLSLTGAMVLFTVIVACYANLPYIIIALLIDGLILLIKHLTKNGTISLDKEEAQAILKKKIPNPFSRFFHKGKSDATDKRAETSC